MALSRFWTVIVLASIGWIFVLLLSGRQYSLSGIVNGRQGDPVIVAEKEPQRVASDTPELFQRIKDAGEDGFVSDGRRYRLTKAGVIEISSGFQRADGLFPVCRNTVVEIWLPLIGYLTFFCGLMSLLSVSGATEKLSRLLAPLLTRLFPDLPKEHPAYGYMTMNFAANFLGLDNAATPFGLKAMASMQETNPEKSRATDGQIMFLCLHAAGLTLIPTSIIGYRAAMNAANPSDVMLPIIMTSFVGTLAAVILVGIRQRINLLSGPLIGLLFAASLLMGGLLFLVGQLNQLEKLRFTGNLGNGVLLFIICIIVAYAFRNEEKFRVAQTSIFDSFVDGAKEGFTTAVRVLPYIVGMLAALSLFRNSGLMDLFTGGMGRLLGWFGVDRQIIDALPVALMRPFSAGGSRGFMLEAMKTYGADSLAGRLSCLFQGAAETTFYVIALYFGSVSVRDTRYTLGTMLLVDAVCVMTAIGVSLFYF